MQENALKIRNGNFLFRIILNYQKSENKCQKIW